LLRLFAVATNYRVNLRDSEWSDINVIAAVLKQYLRQLPVSVIPHYTYDVFSRAVGAFLQRRPHQRGRRGG